MFTFITDRDGKYQLAALAESGFDPLARTCKFMLTEEAHHLFVGESGVARAIQRTCEVMNELKTDDVTKLRQAGVIDLPTIQKYLNFHFSVTSDLYGSEVSSNAATYYNPGLKGRFEETRIADDHPLGSSTCRVPVKLGIPFRFTLPHKGLHRKIGVFNDVHVSPDGRMLSEATWTHHHQEWLPNEIDRAYVQSLMGRVTEAGQFANWIAPPAVGINRQPVNFDYIRFN